MERDPTDRHTDDLAGRVERFEANVDRRFDKVDRRFERFEDKVDARFDRIDSRFDKLDARFDKWGRIMGGGVITIAVSGALRILGVDA